MTAKQSFVTHEPVSAVAYQSNLHWPWRVAFTDGDVHVTNVEPAAHFLGSLCL